MKILYLYQYFTPLVLAGGSRCFQTARRLASAGHEVHIVTSDRYAQDGDSWRREECGGFTVHSLPNRYDNEMSYQRRVKAFVRFAWKSAHRAASIPADVVLASSTPLTIALPAAYARRRLKVPMVFEVRDLWPEAPIAMGAIRNPVVIALARRLERFAYRNASHIIALSPGMRDGIARTGYPSDRIDVIPNGSDVDLFRVPAEAGLEWRRRHPEVGARPMVLYAGAFGRVNGVEWLARLAAESRRRGAETCFYAVGRGSELPRVVRVAEELGVLGNNFFVAPAVPKEEMPALMSAATLCTSVVVNVPELWNNSANKFFDSLAAARPVAVNHLGWQADLIERHGAGLVWPYEDLKRSAETLEAFVTDERRVVAAGEASARLADSQFDRDLLVGRLQRVLEETVREALQAKGQPKG